MPHLAEAQRLQLASSSALEETLGEVLAIVTDRWPTIVLDPAVFLRFLAERIAPELGGAEGLFDLCVGDMYLLAAYERGDPQAVAVIEKNLLTRVEAGLLRLGASRPMIEDIRQILHQRLLSADRKDRGALRYNGKGELVRWLYMAATRTALDMWRKAGRLQPLADASLEQAVLGDDHETAYLKLRYRGEFKEAFQAAFTTLANQDRNVLRYYILDRLNIDQIGTIYRVHRSTVARWISSARQLLLVRTRAAMLQKIKASHATFESVMRLIESELEVSIRRLLQESPADKA